MSLNIRKACQRNSSRPMPVLGRLLIRPARLSASSNVCSCTSYLLHLLLIWFIPSEDWIEIFQGLECAHANRVTSRLASVKNISFWLCPENLSSYCHERHRNSDFRMKRQTDFSELQTMHRSARNFFVEASLRGLDADPIRRPYRKPRRMPHDADIEDPSRSLNL